MANKADMYRMIAIAVLVLLAVHPGIFFTPMRFAAKRKPVSDQSS